MTARALLPAVFILCLAGGVWWVARRSDRDWSFLCAQRTVGGPAMLVFAVYYFISGRALLALACGVLGTITFLMRNDPR